MKRKRTRLEKELNIKKASDMLSTEAPQTLDDKEERKQMLSRSQLFRLLGLDER
jgi:hypothetical protein